MLQSLKKRPKWLATLKPQGFLAGCKYRLETWLAKPTPAPVAPAPKDDDFRHLSFTFAVVALCARMARVDGALTREKYLAFRASFPLQGGICTKIRSLFTLACEDHTPIEHYVSQIKYMYPQEYDLFSSLVDRLFRIAAADGKLVSEEERMLSKVAHMLDLSPNEYWNIRARYENPSAHHILGVSHKVKAGSLKKRYHELMRRYHPDRYAADDLSPELAMLLRIKASEINEAYRLLSKKAA